MNPARLFAGVAVALVCLALSGCSHTEPCTVQAQSNGIWIPVPPDMLAVSLGYSEQVDGKVHLGSRVDVVLVTSSDRGLPLTTTVLRKIEVAGIVPGTPKSLPTVTLLTSPKDAERLARAAQKGGIHLRLRE
jgi:Flp pilus assembly protein CpaB